jgi:GNAT superfamily N-acetyltransferase
VIRPTTPDDVAAILAIAVAAGIAPPDGTAELAGVLTDGLAGKLGPDHQAGGRGTALLRHVERVLAERGERLLLVETSGLPEFERTRAFYLKNGYDEEARIREFWKAGDDKFVFRKALTPPSPTR